MRKRLILTEEFTIFYCASVFSCYKKESYLFLLLYNVHSMVQTTSESGRESRVVVYGVEDDWAGWYITQQQQKQKQKYYHYYYYYRINTHVVSHMRTVRYILLYNVYKAVT